MLALCGARLRGGHGILGQATDR